VISLHRRLFWTVTDAIRDLAESLATALCVNRRVRLTAGASSRTYAVVTSDTWDQPANNSHARRRTSAQVK
jgi:hypothetical protein